MKIIHLFLIQLIGSTFTTLAQPLDSKKINSTRTIRSEVKSDENDWYINLGYVKPLGTKGKNVSIDEISSTWNSFSAWLNDKKSGLDGKSGINLSMGNYFSVLKINKTYNLGIDWTYLNLTLIDYSPQMNSQNLIFSGKYNTPVINLGWRLGPAFKLHLTKNIFCRIHYQLSPSISTLASWTKNEAEISYQPDDLSDFESPEYTVFESGFGIGFGLKHTAGLQLALSKFYLGMSLELGQIKYKVYEWNVKTQASIYQDFIQNNYSYKNEVITPDSQLHLSIGLVF